MESRRSTSISIKEKHEKSVLTSDLVEVNIYDATKSVQTRRESGAKTVKAVLTRVNQAAYFPSFQVVLADE